MAKFAGKPLKRREQEEKEPKIKRRQAPGRSIESRENQIINLAYDLAEKRIKQGTATSQELSHFLKQGSVVTQLEKAKLENENLLLKAKADQIKSQEKLGKLYVRAINAMKRYQGQEDTEDEEMEEDDDD